MTLMLSLLSNIDAFMMHVFVSLTIEMTYAHSFIQSFEILHMRLKHSVITLALEKDAMNVDTAASCNLQLHLHLVTFLTLTLVNVLHELLVLDLTLKVIF